MGAAGVNPPVTSPGLPNIQAIIRAQPELNAFVLSVTLIAAGLLFIGGILGDANGRRGILLGALAVLTAANVFGILVTSGPLLLAGRLVSGAAAFAILPFALALVATTYRGVVRATAIGFLYAVYGLAGIVASVLLTLLDPSGGTWPAFVAASLASAVALGFAWSRTPNLPAIARNDRSYVVATAAWAFAIVMITAGAVNPGNRLTDAFTVGLVAIGLVMIGGYAIWDRRMRAPRLRTLHVARRQVTIAVAVGVIVSFAQAAPLFQLPVFFDLVLDYGALGAIAAFVPFLVALVVAAPVAGVLLRRFAPRTLVAGGLAAVGLGNIVAATVLGRDTAYFALILPLALIGAGFIVATTVRTAIIFASVSRGLPATATAVNEASVLVGGRIGLAALTALITQRALEIYAASLAGSDPSQTTAAVAAFRDLLVAVGTPGITRSPHHSVPQTWRHTCRPSSRRIGRASSEQAYWRSYRLRSHGSRSDRVIR